MHRISTGRGRYNIQNIGVFLWSLGAYRITGAPMTPAATNIAGQAQCYRFSSLGMDTPLFHRAVSQGEQISAAAMPVNVAATAAGAACSAPTWNPASARSYYGPTGSLLITLDDSHRQPVPDPGRQPVRARRVLGEPPRGRQVRGRRRPGARPARRAAAGARRNPASRLRHLLLRVQRPHRRRRVPPGRRLRRRRRGVGAAVP